MTTKKVSKLLTVGAANTAFDALTELGGDPHRWDNLVVTNLHATQYVALGWNNVVPAAATDDDCVRVPPLQSKLVPWVNTLNLFASGAATPVEVRGD